MIHPAFTKSEIARRYFLHKGEALSNQEAANRWRMVRNIDKDIIKTIMSEIFKEQREILKEK